MKEIYQMLTNKGTIALIVFVIGITYFSSLPVKTLENGYASVENKTIATNKK